MLNSLIINITANANDTTDILQTFRKLLLSSSVHRKRTAAMLLQVLIGYSGEKRCKKMKNAKGCLGSDVVARNIRSHMTQLDTRQWWWKINFFCILQQHDSKLALFTPEMNKKHQTTDKGCRQQTRGAGNKQGVQAKSNSSQRDYRRQQLVI